MNKLLFTTAFILLGTAFYIGQSKEAEYYTDLQEENRRITVWEEGYQAGRTQGQKDVIVEALTEFCGDYEMNCGYSPSVAAPLPKPEVTI